jgi:hypothetical protein
VLDANGVGEQQLVEANVSVLSSFFGAVKSCSAQRKFTVATSVPKFGLTELLADPAFLTDITLEADHSSILGFTWDEVASSGRAQLDALAARLGCDRAQVERDIRANYGPGWSWGGKERVFHPYEIGPLFATGAFRDHWASHCPTRRLQLVKPEHRSQIAGLDRRLHLVTRSSTIDVDNQGR